MSSATAMPPSRVALRMLTMSSIAPCNEWSPSTKIISHFRGCSRVHAGTVTAESPGCSLKRWPNVVRSSEVVTFEYFHIIRSKACTVNCGLASSMAADE